MEEVSTENAKVSDSGYSNTCSNSQSHRRYVLNLFDYLLLLSFARYLSRARCKFHLYLGHQFEYSAIHYELQISRAALILIDKYHIVYHFINTVTVMRYKQIMYLDISQEYQYLLGYQACVLYIGAGFLALTLFVDDVSER